MITVDEIKKLRDDTNIGDIVRFTVQINEDKTRVKNSIVEGTIVKKYPFIFELDGGKTYSWVEYRLGRMSLSDEIDYEDQKKEEFKDVI